MPSYPAEPAAHGPTLVRIGERLVWNKGRLATVGAIGGTCLLVGLWAAGSLASHSNRPQPGAVVSPVQVVAPDRAEEAERLRVRNTRLEALVEVMRHREKHSTDPGRK